MRPAPAAEEFDAIVIGSGFGGAVSACRLAEAGRRVAVLERGKRYPPGSFGRSPRELAASFWDPSRGLHGLFDVWSFRKLEAVVASGLGGGSLIYANVLLRKPESWFVREQPRRGSYEYWPVTREDLEPHYDRAEAMLGGTRYPFDRPPYDRTAKTAALQSAGRQRGIDWSLPKLAISFGEPDPVPGIPVGRPEDNLHQAQRYACRLCGECDIGCNYGSKNTTDHTYLSVAQRAGALIEDRCEVRRISWADGRFDVEFVRHRPEREGLTTDTSALPLERWRSKVVVLSAGTLGSTYLLLKCRSAFPRMSTQLGSRFSGNGDLLGFVRGSRSRVLDPAGGPAITSTLSVPDALDGGRGRGYFIQDGGYPEVLSWAIEMANAWGPIRRAAWFVLDRLWAMITRHPRSQLAAQLSAVLGTTRASAGTLPLLGMGRDVADGTMGLRRGWLDVDWTTVTSASFFGDLVASMGAVASALDSHLEVNPTWLLRRVVTVHPLGGAPMGRDEREGVVDDHGEVFGYPGLFVADGSVMPGPVGPNPALTIAALAERFSAAHDRTERPVTDDKGQAPVRRSLIMAGGGTKVAFQAGVLQVWLDEAGLDFDHADGASGGVFNLAMWAQGMSGRQIADNWRRYRPLAAVEPNLGGLLRLPFAPSLFKLERFRRNVLTNWGIDWAAVRATTREATFNLYDFTALEQVVVEAADMDEDRLISAVSLPMWFPPVAIDGHVYIDAVYATDANLEEAVRRGADELWVVWTVSQRGTWRPGFIAHYFQIIEAAATSQLRSILARIDRSNEAFAAGRGGEFGRHVEVKLLQAEVPAHYLLNFRRDRILMAVELGVAAARRWCADQGIPLSPPAGPSADALVAGGPSGIRFTEQMTGFATLGTSDFELGWRAGAAAGDRLRFQLTIEVDDIERFVADPDHPATARGWVEFGPFGGRFPVERGRFNLFVDQGDPATKRMLYELHFTDPAGFPLTLLGYKVVTDDPGFDTWADTTTLYTRLVKGHVSWDDEAETVAAGIIRITPALFLRQLGTFRARADSVGGRVGAMARFGRLFAGQLWDAYVSPSDKPRGLERPTPVPGGTR